MYFRLGLVTQSIRSGASPATYSGSVSPSDLTKLARLFSASELPYQLFADTVRIMRIALFGHHALKEFVTKLCCVESQA